MSLLADKLSQGNKTDLTRDVPPNLKNIVNASMKGAARKKKTILISIVCTLLLLGGSLSVYYFGPLHSGSDADGVDIAVAIAAAKDRHLVKTEKASTDDTKDTAQELAVNESELSPDTPTLPKIALREGENTFEADNNSAGHDSASDQQQIAGDAVVDINTGVQLDEENAVTKNNEVSTDTFQAADMVMIDKTDNEQLVDEPLSVRDMIAPDKEETNRRQPVSHVESSRSDSYLYKARENELSGNYAGALEDYRQALKIDSNSINIINNIAYLYLRLGLIDESIAYSQKALAINDKYAPALINMGIASAQTGDTSAALEYLKSALDLDPGNQTVLLNLAILHERAERFDQASQFYEKLLRLGNSAGYAGLARSYEKQGKFNEALKLYKIMQTSETTDDKLRTVARQRIMILSNDVRNEN